MTPRHITAAAVAGIAIAFYIFVGRVVNAQPPGRQFPGYVTLLQPMEEVSRGQDALRDQDAAAKADPDNARAIAGGSPEVEHVYAKVLRLSPIDRGGAGANPRVRIDVVVCGQPFHGLLLLGEGARLIDAEVLVPDPNRITQLLPVPAHERVRERWEPLRPPVLGSRWRSLSGGEGAVADALAQAIPVSFDQPAPCAPRLKGTGPRLETPAQGSLFSVRGRFSERVLRRHQLGPFQSPRQGQTWPLVGAFSDELRDDVGPFGSDEAHSTVPRPPGGPPPVFSPPDELQLQVGSGFLPARMDVISARPVSVLGEQLEWRSFSAMAPLARLVDAESMGRWQDLITAATISLGLAGSVIAFFLTPLLRSKGDGGDG